MDKRMRTNLLLLIAVIVVALFIWLMPEPLDDSTGVALFAPDVEFSRLEALRDGETRFVLERSGPAWKMVVPVRAAADDFQVQSLLANLRQRAERAYPVAEVDLEQAGLVDAEWSLRVDDHLLQFGARTALGNNRYVQKGDQVYLLSDVMTYRLQREPMDYVSKRLLADGREIVAIRLPAGQQIERQNFSWRLQPENDAVSADAVQDLADAWQHATAMRLQSVATVPEGERVIVEHADGETSEFVIGLTEANFYLTRSEPPLRYELPRGEARRLLQLEVASQLDDGGD